MSGMIAAVTPDHTSTNWRATGRVLTKMREKRRLSQIDVARRMSWSVKRITAVELRTSVAHRDDIQSLREFYRTIPVPENKCDLCRREIVWSDGAYKYCSMHYPAPMERKYEVVPV